MRVTSTSTRRRGRALTVSFLVGCLLTGWSLAAAAQEDGSDPSQVRQRLRTEEQTQSADPQGETVRARLRHRLEHRIGQIPDLEPTERARMVEHDLADPLVTFVAGADPERKEACPGDSIGNQAQNESSGGDGAVGQAG